MFPVALYPDHTTRGRRSGDRRKCLLERASKPLRTRNHYSSMFFFHLEALSSMLLFPSKALSACIASFSFEIPFEIALLRTVHCFELLHTPTRGGSGILTSCLVCCLSCVCLPASRGVCNCCTCKQQVVSIDGVQIRLLHVQAFTCTIRVGPNHWGEVGWIGGRERKTLRG